MGVCLSWVMVRRCRPNSPMIESEIPFMPDSTPGWALRLLQPAQLQRMGI